jgi:hypothetical protein
MLRIVIAAATFLATCAVTLADAAAAEPQRATAATKTVAAPVVQVYSNPG